MSTHPAPLSRAVRSALGRTITRLLTSPALRQATRKRHALWRQLRGAAATVHYFHQSDDPYSQLAAQCLDALAARYRITLISHPVPPPDANAAPDLQRLKDWSLRDAQRLAMHYGLEAPTASAAHMPATLRGLEGAALAQALEQGRALRQKLGHYLGAMFYFEGEWYWGIDRLHYLEQRLCEAGLVHNKADRPAPLFAPPALQRKASQWATSQPKSPSTSSTLSTPSASSTSTSTSTSTSSSPSTPTPPILHFYCSLRSPYTYLAAAQVQRLAQHYGARVQLRFVLPMVMRGLPVPLAKRLYIIRDAQREAERLGLPFGCIVDPVGEPTERGLAVLHKAMALGRGMEMAHSFLQGVFAEGVDAGTDDGLLQLAQRAGLSGADVSAALTDSQWRAVAEANRTDMLARGLWGVPSFRVNDQPAVWGQDRLWMIEQDLIHASAKATTRNPEEPY